MATEKFKRYRSPGIDQIPEELIQAGSRTVSSVIDKFANTI